MTDTTNKPTVTPKGTATAFKATPKTVAKKDVPKTATKTKTTIAATNDKDETMDAVAKLFETMEHLLPTVLEHAKRLDAFEKQNAILQGQCDNLVKIVVGLQTSLLQAKTVDVPVEKVAPKTIAEKHIPTDVRDKSRDAILAETVLRVVENIGSGTFNEKVIPQGTLGKRDYRSWLTTAQHKTFKVAFGIGEKNGGHMTLVGAATLLADAVDAGYNIEL